MIYDTLDCLFYPLVPYTKIILPDPTALQCPQKVDKNVDFSWTNFIDKNEVILPSSDYKLSSQINFYDDIECATTNLYDIIFYNFFIFETQELLHITLQFSSRDSNTELHRYEVSTMPLRQR